MNCPQCREPIASIMMIDGKGPEYYCVSCVKTYPIKVRAQPRELVAA